jgi:AcrR family transcriptional regulator
MGNREELLAGAQRVLLTKGYSRSTARDIATEAHVSLAAIGYHFGSKDALMNEALYAAIGAWGEQMEAAFMKVGRELDPAARFEKIWASISDTFDHQNELWLASFEMITNLDHIPGAREAFAQIIPEARKGLMALFLGIQDESTISEDDARAIGGIYYCMMAGLLVQRYADASSAPSPKDMARGLRAVADSLDPQG